MGRLLSSEDFGIGFPVESHEHLIAQSQGRRAQIPRRAEHRFLQVLFRRLLAQVETQHLFALGHNQVAHPIQHAMQVIGAKSLLLGIHRLTDGGAAIANESVATFTGVSALAVVVPVDAFAHGI